VTGFFLFATASRPVLGPTLASYPMGTGGILHQGLGDRGVKLTTRPRLVPWLTMRGSIPPHPQYVFIVWCSVKHKGKVKGKVKVAPVL
jgi:hypothetical protein